LACVALVLTIALLSAVGRDDPIAAAQEAAHHGGLPKLKVVRELKPAHHAVSWMSDDVAGVVWSSDGTKLAAYSEYGNLITVWSADGRILQELHRPGMPDGSVAPLAFVHNNREIVTPSGNYCARMPCSPHEGIYSGIAFSVFDIASGRIVHELIGPRPGEKYPYPFDTATVLAPSPSQPLLAVVTGTSHESPVMLYSTLTWDKLDVLPQALGPLPFAPGPQSVAFSADGKLLAFGMIDGILVVYDVASRKIIRRIEASHYPEPSGSWVTFSPEGRMIAVDASGFPGAIRLPNGQLTNLVPRDRVRVFRTADGARVAAYGGRPADSSSGQWCPDGRFIAVVADFTLYIWNPSAPDSPARILPLRRGAFGLAFSPDGHMLAVANGPSVTLFGLR